MEILEDSNIFPAPQLNEPEIQGVFAHLKTQIPDTIYDKLAKKCQCAYHRADDEEERYWQHTFSFETVVLGQFSHAVYKPGTTSSGIVVISDAMATELIGSRALMITLASNGHHVIKPMLYESPDTHAEFLEMIVMYYNQGRFPSKLPDSIQQAIDHLKTQGVTSISLVGVCWGGCIVQQLISTDDSFTCGVSIDGIFYQPDFAALVPSLFIVSNEKNRKETHIQMKNVMWRNNIYPWDMHITDFPLEHGFLMKGFECSRSKKVNIPNTLGISDAEFKNICEVITQSHRHFLQMITDFFVQFNGRSIL